MIVKCITCHHEAQVVSNLDPCDWCNSPMHSIGSDSISEEDDSVTSHKLVVDIPDDDAELPLDLMFCGSDTVLRIK